jgi:hypothetical protein
MTDGTTQPKNPLNACKSCGLFQRIPGKTKTLCAVLQNLIPTDLLAGPAI